MPAPSPIVLLFSSALTVDVDPYLQAARRAGVGLRVVTDHAGHRAPTAVGEPVPARFGPEPAHVDEVLRELEGGSVDGVLVADARAAWLAAQVARARGVSWHAPEAVAVATDRLLTRGRFLAAGLPTPWFVGLSTHSDHDDVERLARVTVPCLVAPSDATALGGIARADSWDDVVAARTALAAAHADQARTGGLEPMLVVEGLVPGRELVLAGVLEQGALRVFALFEGLVLPNVGEGQGTVHVTPARIPPERQHVVAGHAARAALTLGLHHGPVHATCRVDDDAIVVLAVSPTPPEAHLARALPVVAPDRTRCTFEDALLAHALGRPLDHFGHQAIASGVLTLDGPRNGSVVVQEGRDDVAAMPWVTGTEFTPTSGGLSWSGAGGAVRAGLVYAQGAQPDDVVATLEEAGRRLRVVVEPTTTTTR